MIKITLLLLHLSLSIFAYDKITIPNKDLSYESKKNLEFISKYAIKIGTGTLHRTYIFVDPMCPFSKKYITKLTKNKMAQALNSYYIFLNLNIRKLTLIKQSISFHNSHIKYLQLNQKK